MPDITQQQIEHARTLLESNEKFSRLGKGDKQLLEAYLRSLTSVEEKEMAIATSPAEGRAKGWLRKRAGLMGDADSSASPSQKTTPGTFLSDLFAGKASVIGFLADAYSTAKLRELPHLVEVASEKAVEQKQTVIAQQKRRDALAALRALEEADGLTPALQQALADLEQ